MSEDPLISISTKTSTHKVRKCLLASKSSFFASQTLSNSFVFSSPFDTEFAILINWIETGDIEPIKSLSLDSLLSLYALSRYFQIKPFTNLKTILLSQQPKVYQFDIRENYSDALHRSLIDLPFLLYILKKSYFPPNQSKNLAILVLLFEWLGEKTCSSEEDFEDLKTCKELKTFKSALWRQNLNIESEAKNLRLLFPFTMKYLDLIN